MGRLNPNQLPLVCIKWNERGFQRGFELYNALGKCSFLIHCVFTEHICKAVYVPVAFMVGFLESVFTQVCVCLCKPACADVFK